MFAKLFKIFFGRFFGRCFRVRQANPFYFESYPLPAGGPVGFVGVRRRGWWVVGPELTDDVLRGYGPRTNQGRMLEEICTMIPRNFARAGAVAAA